MIYVEQLKEYKQKQIKDLYSILDFCLNKLNNFFFIQIGANNRIMDEPFNRFICKYENMNGILIEPQKKNSNY